MEVERAAHLDALPGHRLCTFLRHEPRKYGLTDTMKNDQKLV